MTYDKFSNEDIDADVLKNVNIYISELESIIQSHAKTIIEQARRIELLEHKLEQRS